MIHKSINICAYFYSNSYWGKNEGICKAHVAGFLFMLAASMLVTSGVSDLSRFRHLYPACFLSLSPVVKMWAILAPFHSFLLAASCGRSSLQSHQPFPSPCLEGDINVTQEDMNGSGHGEVQAAAAPQNSCGSLGGGTRWIPRVLSDLWEEVSHLMNPRNQLRQLFLPPSFPLPLLLCLHLCLWCVCMHTCAHIPHCI